MFALFYTEIHGGVTEFHWEAHSDQINLAFHYSWAKCLQWRESCGHFHFFFILSRLVFKNYLVTFSFLHGVTRRRHGVPLRSTNKYIIYFKYRGIDFYMIQKWRVFLNVNTWQLISACFLRVTSCTSVIFLRSSVQKNNIQFIQSFFQDNSDNTYIKFTTLKETLSKRKPAMSVATCRPGGIRLFL